VYNLAGTVEIASGPGREVVVEVTRGGDDGGSLQMEMREVDGREALIVRYPEGDIVYPAMGRGSNTEIGVRGDGSFYGDWSFSRSHRVRISGSGRGTEAWADLRITVPAGGDLAVFLAVGPTTLDGVEGSILIDAGSGAIDAREGKGRLSVDTGSGEVTVMGFEGELQVDTGSGNVELADVLGGDVVIDTGSGSIVGSGVTARSLRMDTGSGRIRARGVSAPSMVLDTGSGSVDLELTGDLDDAEIDTGSGSVTVRLPESLGAEVWLDTGSGNVEIDVPFEARDVERGYVRGTLGDGRGRLRIDTGSGRIHLTRG
jgi:lia operon protein LiaG